jgi:tocopherol O-methyltransferase
MMIVETYKSVENNPTSVRLHISKFWDNYTNLWNEIWGPHIHHGYYSSHENPSIAPQELLIEKIIEKLNIKPNQTLLDVGCGIGESAFYLSQHLPISITGITLSKIQLALAQQEAQKRNLQHIEFKIEDAHSLQSFADNTFDIVWSLESCEQFSNKELFLKQAYRVLKPNGKIMIATWCSDKEQYENKEAKQYIELCKYFCIPYMPTINYYSQLIKKDFDILYIDDWSKYVIKSWALGLSKLKTYSYFKLFMLSGFSGLKAINKIHLISNGFQTGKIRYGVFVAQKIPPSGKEGI